ncbi:MAG: isoprenylcysteine carboxyl methyltransferase family protein [Myxococcales bacterium]
MGLKVYYVFLALMGAERLAELWLSRRNARRAFGRGGVETGASHFRAMAVVHFLLFPACLLEARALLPAFAAIALGAQALRWWAIHSLGDRWNVRVIVVPGEAPVRRGPYRWVRHPNYVAVAVEMLCVPLAGGAWASAIVFSAANAVLLRIRIREEERALGDRYQQEFGKVPRFIPHG